MWRKGVLKIFGLCGIVSVFWFLHQGAIGTKSASTQSVGNSNPTAAGVPNPTTQQDIVRGMAMQINYTADGIDKYLRMIDEIAELGANTVGLSAAGYQEHAGSAAITLDIRKCPSKRQFAQLIARARSHGLRVMLMPVVLLSNGRGNEWRGTIQPPDWDQWWSSYLSFIKYFAEVGQNNNVEILVVGAELVSTDASRDRWIQVIKEVRRTYHGTLLYSANWDHYTQVSFWDQLDVVGMTTYHELADKENPPLATLLENWSQIKKGILAWQKTIGKPIIFTEVGWCSQPGASIEAWNYYRHQSPSKQGLEEQAKCYEAFIRTWQKTPGVAGVMWWEWTNGPGGAKDYNYTPKGKPAERMLRQWFRQKGRTSTQPTRREGSTHLH